MACGRRVVGVHTEVEQLTACVQAGGAEIGQQNPCLNRRDANAAEILMHGFH